ncbi:MAG: 2,3-bisphosphoglycerate-independent phosphoglycerate mutase [Bacilli bacterium]|nr:2,3-bisphosphoglycerate-independent phosphoglycerate mutase [Bacilli bacterium]
MKPLLLAILDGYGIREETKGNAIKLTQTPNFDFLWNTYPHSTLDASGQPVGLPRGQMGNSEVGHMNIGAGRLVYQPQELINSKIKDGSFLRNKEILKVINHTKEQNSRLHIMGLISDGGVHSHIDHLMAILDMCQQNAVEKLYLHLFTDGRDVDKQSSYKYISRVEEKLSQIGIGKIASIGGRYYGMDRDNNYDRLKKGYDAIVNAVGIESASIKEYIEESYQNGITDEFLLPAVFEKNGNIKEDDGVIVFNYRKDRLREILTAITNPDFKDMEVNHFSNVKLVTMLPVVESVLAPHAFQDPELTNILGEYLEKQGLSQLRIAETEKYAHVTFFFDGGKEVDYKNEKKILIPSPKVATYDLKPEMSIEEVTDALVKELDENKYDVIILNYANCDMVGHTGILEAAMKAVEAVDRNLGRIYNKIQELGGTLIVTADHGNCELMMDEKGNVITSHTTNKVPFIICDKKYQIKEGKLGDIAPTMLKILGIEIPKQMTGNPLV